MFLFMNGSGGSRSHVCSRMLRLLYRVVRMLSVAVVWVWLSVVTMLSLCNVGIYLTALWECLLVGSCHWMLGRTDVRWISGRDAGRSSARESGSRSRDYVGRMWCHGSRCYVRILERWTKYELRVRHGVLHGSLDAVLFPCIWTWRYGVLGTLSVGVLWTFLVTTKCRFLFGRCSRLAIFFVYWLGLSLCHDVCSVLITDLWSMWTYFS